MLLNGGVQLVCKACEASICPSSEFEFRVYAFQEIKCKCAGVYLLTVHLFLQVGLSFPWILREVYRPN